MCLCDPNIANLGLLMYVVYEFWISPYMRMCIVFKGRPPCFPVVHRKLYLYVKCEHGVALCMYTVWKDGARTIRVCVRVRCNSIESEISPVSIIVEQHHARVSRGFRLKAYKIYRIYYTMWSDRKLKKHGNHFENIETCLVKIIRIIFFFLHKPYTHIV